MCQISACFRSVFVGVESLCFGTLSFLGKGRGYSWSLYDCSRHLCTLHSTPSCLLSQFPWQLRPMHFQWRTSPPPKLPLPLLHFHLHPHPSSLCFPPSLHLPLHPMPLFLNEASWSITIFPIPGKNRERDTPPKYTLLLTDKRHCPFITYLRHNFKQLVKTTIIYNEFLFHSILGLLISALQSWARYGQRLFRAHHLWYGYRTLQYSALALQHCICLMEE